MAEFPTFVPFHCQDYNISEPGGPPSSVSLSSAGFSDPDMRESAALLATLSLLASRKEPEMAAVSKVLCSQLEWSDQRAALIGAEILAASGLFSPSAKAQPIFPILEDSSTSLNIDRTVFDDHEVQLALWKAADPDFALLQACSQPAEPALANSTCAHSKDTSSIWGPQMVANLLAKLGIHYTLNDTSITLDTQKIMGKLIWGYRWVPEAAEHIYEILFSQEAWSAISQAMEKEGVFESDSDDEKEDFFVDFYSFDHLNAEGIDADMKQSLKLLAMSVTLFLGAGLVLGHTLT